VKQHQPQVYKEWLRMVIKQMSHLSKPQAVVLSMWSFAIAMTHHCGLSTVTVFLAEIFEQPENTLRERLRQWYFSSSEKKGKKRGQIDIEQSFVPLLRWILNWWSSAEKSLVFAADATTLGQRFTLLVISVVYRGSGIPVAWKVIPANEKGSWQPHWLKLLFLLSDGVPDGWWVIVTTDRGLYAPWLYEAIKQLGWHPFMPINHQGYYRFCDREQYQPLSELVTQVGQFWSGQVNCFKTNSLSCTLLARWDEGYADPWLIVTDLHPQDAQICWYGMRSWIECLFKDLKRGGFGWHHTKMDDPQRAERLWLAISVATLFLVSVGGKAEANLPPSSLPPLSEMTSDIDQGLSNSPSSSVSSSVSSLSIQNNSTRLLSCFRRGFLVLLASVIKRMPLPQGSFIPDFSPAPG
jgi:hypothetical protein